MARDLTALQAIISPAIEGLGYELVGCRYIPQRQHGVLRIYIDSAKGIALADCERVSRHLSALLDVEDPIPTAYSLEVSSPGLDRPLFTLAHYQRFIGAMLRLTLHVAHNNRRHFTGLLKAVSGDKITLLEGTQEFELPFTNIAKANLLADINMKLNRDA